MAMIKVDNLTFGYEGSYDNVFENVSFQIDTNWKLGLIGRNGKGKSTFLQLLMEQNDDICRPEYRYSGTITGDTCYQYFPVDIPVRQWQNPVIELMEQEFPDNELWKVIRELEYLSMEANILYRTFGSLSFGERTRVMLAYLFSNENNFLLLDEPTNHLDMETRETVIRYLKRKQGFILVSHERDFLDSCVDHILAINRNSITVTKGNFTAWWENKEKQDSFELARNADLRKDIKRLETAARQSKEWADTVEKRKIGFNPVKEDRFIGTRSYLGEKSRRMQQRRKNLERRQREEIEEKRQLLQDIEQDADLKMFPLKYRSDRLLSVEKLSIKYDSDVVCRQISFEIHNGGQILLQGRNGCGKSSIIKAILGETAPAEGSVTAGSGVKISYVSQDTSMLGGTLQKYASDRGIELSLLMTVLRQLDFERVQFEKNISDYSEGQKKKVMLAASLCEQAHLYIWDEPYNFIDVFSRMQIEKLIQRFQPTMLLVEHDKYFAENIGAKAVQIN